MSMNINYHMYEKLSLEIDSTNVTQFFFFFALKDDLYEKQFLKNSLEVGN